MLLCYEDHLSGYLHVGTEEGIPLRPRRVAYRVASAACVRAAGGGVPLPPRAVPMAYSPYYPGRFPGPVEPASFWDA